MKSLILCLLVAGALAAPSFKPRFQRGQSRIVGGDDATVGEFPYQISFQEVIFGYDFHFCGVSVLSPTVMITAGHCVEGDNFNNPDGLKIVAGDLTLYTPEGNEQTSKVVRIVRHPGFSMNTIENDISLLFVETELTFNTFLSAVNLPSQ